MLAKFFTESPEGVIVHWEVDAGNLPDLHALVDSHLSYLQNGNFTANRGFGNGSSTTAAKQSPSQPPKEAKVPAARPSVCGVCGEAAMVRITDKATDKSPDFRCSECDAAAWGPKKDGTYAWRESTKR